MYAFLSDPIDAAAMLITADGQKAFIHTPKEGLMDEDIKEILGGEYTGHMDEEEENTILVRADIADGDEPVNVAATQLAYRYQIIPLGTALYGNVIWGYKNAEASLFLKTFTRNLPIINY